MSFIELMLRLYESFVGPSSKTLKRIKSDAEEWYEERQKSAKGILRKFFDFEEQWYAQIGISFVWIWLTKFLGEWMNQISRYENGEVEEEDERAL